MKRLTIYLAATFFISWTCWWTLVREMPADGSVFSSALFTILYLVGGFGPTIGAVIAVLATREHGGFGEYCRLVARWRVNPLWWLAAASVPVLFAATKEWIAIWTGGDTVHAGQLAPLRHVVTLFPTMIIGGGLEELGWRGVAQPQAETRMPRWGAALTIGAIWAVWHLPLFHIAGVSQSGRNFPLFAVDVLGNACLLAWVFAGTRSILLCVVFHAMSNTATAMGVFAIGQPTDAGAWSAVTLKLAAALALLLFAAPRRARSQTASV